jgi:hypothetical protein
MPNESEEAEKSLVWDIVAILLMLALILFVFSFRTSPVCAQWPRIC